MYSIESFKDLQSEIEISKIRIEGLEKQRELLLKLINKPPAGYKSIDMSGMPKGSRNDISLDRLVDQINRLDNMLFLETELLNNMENTYNKTYDKLKGLEGTKYKIAFKRLIEGKSYKTIAIELNMNESYVRALGAEINKEKH